jgi:hypothetical protein
VSSHRRRFVSRDLFPDVSGVSDETNLRNPAMKRHLPDICLQCGSAMLPGIDNAALRP